MAEKAELIARGIYEVLYGAVNVPFIPLSIVDGGKHWAGLVGEDARRYGEKPVSVARWALRIMPESVRRTVDKAVIDGLEDYRRRYG